MKKILVWGVVIAMIAALPTAAFAAESGAAPADNDDSLKISDEVMDQICGNAFEKVIKIYSVTDLTYFSQVKNIDLFFELYDRLDYSVYEFYALQLDEGEIIYRELTDDSYVNLLDTHESRQTRNTKWFFDNAGAAKLSEMFSDITVYNTYCLYGMNGMGILIYYKTNKGDFVFRKYHYMGNSEYLFPIKDFCEFMKETRKVYIEFAKTSVGIPDISDVWDLSKYDIHSDLFAPLSNIGIEAASEGDLTFKLNEDGNSYSVYECNSSASGDLIIPAAYEGKPITCIGKYAFQGCKGLTTVTIPKGVTSIGENAFSFCSNLTSVTIPNSVTEIGDEAFSYCDSLTSVTIPNSITEIRLGAFFDCESLTSVTIPDSVTKIETHAFYSCKNLKNVYYSGDETQFAEIEIERSNDYLINAEIVYNYPPGTATVLIVIIIAAVLALAATTAVIIIRKRKSKAGDGSVS